MGDTGKHFVAGLLDGVGGSMQAIGARRYADDVARAQELRAESLEEMRHSNSKELEGIRHQNNLTIHNTDNKARLEQAMAAQGNQRRAGAFTDKQFSDAMIEAREAYQMSPESKDREDKGNKLNPLDNTITKAIPFHVWLQAYSPTLYNEAVRRGVLKGTREKSVGGSNATDEAKKTIDELLNDKSANKKETPSTTIKVPEPYLGKEFSPFKKQGVNTNQGEKKKHQETKLMRLGKQNMTAQQRT